MTKGGPFKDKWVGRLSNAGVLLTAGHFVESDVADRAVTHCGHEMHHTIRAGTLDVIPEGMVYHPCMNCVGVSAKGGGKVKKYKPGDTLPDHIGKVGDSPIANRDLPEKSKHKPEDDKGDANRKDKG